MTTSTLLFNSRLHASTYIVYQIPLCKEVQTCQDFLQRLLKHLDLQPNKEIKEVNWLVFFCTAIAP